MKDLSMLIWMTQLGLSVALPLAGFVFLAVWIRNSFSLGVWVIIVGVVLGLICAINGLVNSLRAMQLITKDKKEKKKPLAFNEHD